MGSSDTSARAIAHRRLLKELSNEEEPIDEAFLKALSTDIDQILPDTPLSLEGYKALPLYQEVNRRLQHAVTAGVGSSKGDFQLIPKSSVIHALRLGHPEKTLPNNIKYSLIMLGKEHRLSFPKASKTSPTVSPPAAQAPKALEGMELDASLRTTGIKGGGNSTKNKGGRQKQRMAIPATRSKSHLPRARVAHSDEKDVIDVSDGVDDIASSGTRATLSTRQPEGLPGPNTTRAPADHAYETSDGESDYCVTITPSAKATQRGPRNTRNDISHREGQEDTSLDTKRRRIPAIIYNETLRQLPASSNTNDRLLMQHKVSWKVLCSCKRNRDTCKLHRNRRVSDRLAEARAAANSLADEEDQ